jgi:hypothetical protein
MYCTHRRVGLPVKKGFQLDSYVCTAVPRPACTVLSVWFVQTSLNRAAPQALFRAPVTGPGSPSRFHLSGGNRRCTCTCAAPTVALLMTTPARPSSNAGFHPPSARPPPPGRRALSEDLGSGNRAPQVPRLSVLVVMRFHPFLRDNPYFCSIALLALFIF